MVRLSPFSIELIGREAVSSAVCSFQARIALSCPFQPFARRRFRALPSVRYVTDQPCFDSFHQGAPSPCLVLQKSHLAPCALRVFCFAFRIIFEGRRLMNRGTTWK